MHLQYTYPPPPSFPRITHSLPNGKQGTLVFTAGDTPSARKNKLGELEVVGVMFVLTHSISNGCRSNCSEPHLVHCMTEISVAMYVYL